MLALGLGLIAALGWGTHDLLVRTIAPGARVLPHLAVVMAVGLGGGYVWLKQIQAGAAEEVPGGLVPAAALRAPAGVRAPVGAGEDDGFVAPALDEAQPGEEGER